MGCQVGFSSIHGLEGLRRSYNDVLRELPAHVRGGGGGGGGDNFHAATAKTKNT